MAGILSWLSTLSKMLPGIQTVALKVEEGSDELPSTSKTFEDLMSCGGLWCPDLLSSDI